MSTKLADNDNLQGSDKILQFGHFLRRNGLKFGIRRKSTKMSL